jgi:hypothetical protein
MRAFHKLDDCQIMSDAEILYHYTSAEGLLGMLGTPGRPGEIWMTQIQYMNDAEEWWEAQRFLADCLYSMRNCETPVLRELANQLNYPKEFGFGRISFARYYVFSLSSERDLLSQWRGYAPSGGYSVGFDVKSLVSIADKNEFALLQCIYNREEKQAIIDDLVKEVKDDLQNGVVDRSVTHWDGGSPMKEIEPTPLLSASHKLQTRFYMMGTFFKHPSFHEERETRLVGMVPAGGIDGRAKWRTKGGLIIPYCAINIDESEAGSSPIREVVIGPGLDPILAKHSIEYANYERHKNMLISESASTLRR